MRLFRRRKKKTRPPSGWLTFRQPETEILKYLDGVARAWRARDAMGVTPLEQRNGRWLDGPPRPFVKARGQ